MFKISKKLRVFVINYPSRETKFSKNCSFKEKPLFFFLWTVSLKFGRKFAVSRVFLSRNLKHVLVSLKLEGFWWNGRPYTRLGPRAGAAADKGFIRVIFDQFNGRNLIKKCS